MATIFPKTAADLPAPDCRAWGAHRKAAVVKAIEQGLITAGEACRRYSLSMDELAVWQRGGISNKTLYELRKSGSLGAIRGYELRPDEPAKRGSPPSQKSPP